MRDCDRCAEWRAAAQEFVDLFEPLAIKPTVDPSLLTVQARNIRRMVDDLKAAKRELKEEAARLYEELESASAHQQLLQRERDEARREVRRLREASLRVAERHDGGREMSTKLQDDAQLIGCGDNSCIFKLLRPGGMGTNGGCRCFEDLVSWNEDAQRWNRDEVRKVKHATLMLLQQLRVAEKERDEARAALAREQKEWAEIKKAGTAAYAEERARSDALWRERDEARAEAKERAHAAEKRCAQLADEAALAQHERDEARTVLESTKERALSAEREVDATLRVLNGYRGFPLPSAAMHAKVTLERLEAKVEKLLEEAVQKQAEIDDAIEAARIRGAQVIDGNGRPKTLLEIVGAAMHDLISTRAAFKDCKEVLERTKAERDEARAAGKA